MARPVKSKSVGQHLIALSRMLRAVEVDRALPAARQRKLVGLLKELIREFGTPAEESVAADN